jgi:hypothetical protein
LESDRRLKDVLDTGPNVDPARFFSASPFSATGTPLTPAVISQDTYEVNVYQQPGEDSDALADRVLGKLRTRARGQTGDTRDWGRLR